MLNLKLEATVAFLKQLKDCGEVIMKITSSLTLWGVENRFFFLVKDDEAIGWLELEPPVTIKHKKYQSIKFIYFLPKFRSSLAAGAFLIAVKKQLKTPLILGSDSYGGVLFKDGLSLVKKMHRGSIFDVKILNLKTGEKTEFSDLQTSRGETLIFENTEFPLICSVADDMIQLYTLEGCEE